VAFLLLDSSLFMSKLKKGMGEDNPLVTRFSQFGHQIVSYVVIRVRVNLITGSAFAAMLLVLGIDFAVLWGVLAFFLSFIPYLGLTLATIPPLLLAIAEYGIGRGLLVIAGMLLINFTAEIAVAPAMMGQGLNLSPVIVFFAFFFWAWLLGPLGLFLAMPVTMFLLMILDSYEDTRWIAVLMSNNSGQDRPDDEDTQIGEMAA
jgi:AI-2 transport protein TqsA